MHQISSDHLTEQRCSYQTTQSKVYPLEASPGGLGEGQGPLIGQVVPGSGTGSGPAFLRPQFAIFCALVF